MTAKIEEGKIKLLEKTLFPSRKRYAISNSGLAGCLDRKKKVILYGQLNKNGEFDFMKILDFPDMLNPKSFCIINEFIILGGKNSEYEKGRKSLEPLVSYSTRDDKFIPLDIPNKEYDINDLLVNESQVTAVVTDNDFQFNLLDYEFKKNRSPNYLKSINLPLGGGKGTQNEKYLALLSYDYCFTNGDEPNIEIFIIGKYLNYIHLSRSNIQMNQNPVQGNYRFFVNSSRNKKNDDWKDILLIPDKNVLLISSNEAGLGFYYLHDEAFVCGKYDEVSDSVIYFNKWNKRVVKLLLLPNDSKNVIVILEEGELDNAYYSYSIENIEDLIQIVNERIVYEYISGNTVTYFNFMVLPRI